MEKVLVREITLVTMERTHTHTHTHTISHAKKFLIRMRKFRAVTKGRCLQIQRYFCAVWDYAGKADLSKGYWNPKRKLNNHAFFRDN